MAKSKEKSAANGGKRGLLSDDPFSTKDSTSRPSKKAKLLDDSDSSDNDEGGVALKVNDEYARRFEYNKKREEKHRCL
jgi:protein KRI1